jgi:integrator complex subunit 1
LDANLSPFKINGLTYQSHVLFTIAEIMRRKKILRSAQKTIMLWDPKGPARKPPRESVQLLLSVERLFGLSEIYQTVANPDLVLGTIGNTTRGAIERAYDWLIPIISSLPNIIARLPANASCFLLLRAYGTDGGERAKLKELSRPLLVHIRDCLSGKFGLNDAIRAADLLLSDVASPKPDVRRCARRVLQESIGRVDGEEIDPAFKENNCSWMLSILKSEHADVLVVESIKHLVSALHHMFVSWASRISNGTSMFCSHSRPPLHMKEAKCYEL